MRLFLVGPTPLWPGVAEIMGREMNSHRTPEYRDLHNELHGQMKSLLGADEVIFLSSSATAVQEASARQCVQDKLLMITTGNFGERFNEFASTSGKTVVKHPVEWGQGVTPDLVGSLIEEHSPDAVGLVYNETSTSAFLPLKEIAAVTKSADVTLLVDAVSCMGGAPIDMSWGIDVIFAGVQKCFGIPPGLTNVGLSKKALELAEAADPVIKGAYFDFNRYAAMNKKDYTPFTPSFAQQRALNHVLHEILRDPEAHYRMYAGMAEQVRQTALAAGLSLFAQDGFHSPTVTTIRTPDAAGLVTKLAEKGHQIASGYGKVKAETVRIGNMGGIRPDDVAALCEDLPHCV